MKISETLNAARLRAGAILRERRERAAERRAAKAQQRGGHDSRFWLLSIPATATLCAAFVEVYWAILFCIEATGSLDGSWSTSLGSQQAAAGAWHFIFDIRNMFVLIGLVAATIPIVMWSMVWLPVQMKARGHGRWRRLTMIGAGLLANALVIMSGTVVMNSNRQDQVRANLVTEQVAQQNVAGRRATAEATKAELDDIAVPQSAHPTYQQQACRVGATAWQARVATAQAQGDYQFPAIQRALADASHCDDLRRQYREALASVYSAPVAAQTQANVRDDVGVGLNTFAQYATVYRPPFVALICTIIGIFGAWWWVGLSEAMDRHNVSLSGWADEGHRIEDLRAEEPVVADPFGMRPAKSVLRDADTGETIIDKDGDLAVIVKEHTRKKKDKTGKPIKMMVTPTPEPDDVGVPPELDGRDAELRSSMHQPVEEWSAGVSGESEAQAGETHAEPPISRLDRDDNEQRSPDDGNRERSESLEESHHPEPPEPDFTDEALQSINALAEEATDEPTGEPVEPASMIDAEPEAVADERPHEPAREPETDPARLIAAE